MVYCKLLWQACVKESQIKCFRCLVWWLNNIHIHFVFPSVLYESSTPTPSFKKGATVLKPTSQKYRK